MRKIRLPSPAMTVALLALIVGLAGTGYAAKRLGKNVVKQRNLATNSVTNRQTKFWKSGPVRKVSASASQAAAPRIELASRGALHVYGKCFLENTSNPPDVNVFGEIYMRSTRSGALVQSDDDEVAGDQLIGFLDPGDDENETEMLHAQALTPGPDADAESHSYFHGLQGNTALNGLAMVFAKTGNLPEGNGPYGAGTNRCIFQAISGGIG